MLLHTVPNVLFKNLRMTVFFFAVFTKKSCYIFFLHLSQLFTFVNIIKLLV